jgi:hypothetical protein
MSSNPHQAGDDFLTTFQQLDDEFKSRYGRSLFVTAGDNAEHRKLHPGGARDVRTKDMSDDERQFVKSRAPELGLNLRDYSWVRQPFTTSNGYRVTGQHFHLDADRKGGQSNVGVDREPAGSNFDEFLRRNNINDSALAQPVVDSGTYVPAKYDPFSGKPTVHLAPAPGAARPEALSPVAAAGLARNSDGGSASTSQTSFEKFLTNAGISDSPVITSPQIASAPGTATTQVSGDHPLFSAALNEVMQLTGVGAAKAREFLASKPGRKSYPGLPVAPAIAPTAAISPADTQSVQATEATPAARAAPAPVLTTEDLMAATPAEQINSPQITASASPMTPTANNPQQSQPGVYVPAPYDPFSGKPTVHAAPAPTGPRPDTEPPRHRAPLYRPGQLLPSENIADEAALDQRLVELARMRADLLGHPAEEAAPSLAAVDEKIRQLSQVKNDLARMRAGGEQSPQAPSHTTPAQDKSQLPWNQRGVTADIASGLLSLPVSIEKMALGAERGLGITPTPGYEEHIAQAERDLEEIASRGQEGLTGEVARGAASALSHLPMFIGAGGTTAGLAATSGLEAAGNSEPTTPEQVAKSALIGAATGKVLHESGTLTMPKRLLVGALVGGGGAAIEGANRQQTIAQTIIGAGLGAMAGRRVQDSTGKTYEVVKDDGETVELRPVAGLVGDESSPQTATPAPLARSGDAAGAKVSLVNDERATGMTPGRSGTTSLSNEELVRTERFFKVDRGSSVTSLGKQPDAPLRDGEAVIAIAPDGAARIVNSSGRIDESQAIARARETLRQQSTLSIGEQVMEKAPPALVQEVESTPLRVIADKSGLDPHDATKGVNDVLADGTREFSPEAVAVKRGILRDESTAPAGQSKFDGFLAKHGLDERGSPLARTGDAGQGERAIAPAFELSKESRAAFDAHRLPADEITRAASTAPAQDEPEFVRAARARLRQSLAGNQLNANPLGALRDVALVTGYDVIKGTLNKADWAREMTLRLGRKVKPLLDDVWDHLTSGKFGAADVKRRLEQTRLIPSSVVEEALSGKRPEHIDSIVDFLGEQRKKIRDGAMTTSDLARAYTMTVASQGADAIRVDTLKTKLEAAGVRLDIPNEYATRNKAGESVIRPEDAMGLWLQSEHGQSALAALERGQFDSRAWNEASKVRSAFGDDRLRNRNVFGDQGGSGYHLRNIEKLVPLFNGAKGNPKSIGQLAAKLNGIAGGKAPFLKMLLGFGDSPTVDAVEINTWLTGRGSTRNAAGRDVELARAVKDFAPNNPGLMSVVSDRINRRFQDLRKSGVVGSDLSKEDFGATVHHWLWDRMKGTENPQRAMYEAMRSEPDFIANSRARLRESLSGKRMNANPLEDLYHAAVVTGWDLYQGAKSFGAWSKQMLDEFGDAVKPHLEKIWQQFEGVKAEPGAASRRRVENFPVADIRTDPARFQYKIDHARNGASGTFDRSAKFDSDRAVRDPLQVWKDPADGKVYVVDGHNRLGLARRDKVESVPVEFIKASDATEARAVGALRNILKGNGSDKDTTAFLKDSGITPEQADRLMRDNGLGNASASIAKSSETITAPEASPDRAVSSKAPEPIARPSDAAGGNQAAPLKLRQKPLEVVSTLIKSGLLSGVQTTARNLLSTISHLAAEGGPTRAIASMVDILVAGRKGERSITGPSPVQMTRAAIEAATTGMKEAAEIIKRGTPDNELDRLANSKEISTGSHVGDMIVNFPFRFLAAQDKVMKVYAFRESLENRAMAEALSEKRAGRIGADSVDGLARDIVRDAKAGRRDDLVLSSWGDAEIATFNNENKLGKNLQRIKGEAGQLGKFTIDQAALFVSVPWNVLRRQLDGMGLGFGVEATKALARKISGEAFPTLEDQRRFATMAGRLGTGAAVGLLGAYLNQQGLMTGYNEEKGGKPKASLLINGRWYRMDLIPPFGALLALGATLQGEMTRELGKNESRASAVAGATAESLIPQHPFARPLTETIEPMFEAAHKRSFAPLEKTAESLAGRVVPSIVAEAARAGDDKERDTHGAVDAMKARIPGLREQLPAQRDGLGREVERSGAPGVVGGMVDVFKSVPDKAATNPVDRELQAAGLVLPGLMQARGESDEHFQKRADQMGKMMQERLTALINSQAYQDLSPALKKLSLATVRNDAKRDYHEQAKGGKIATPEAAAWNVEVRVAELRAKEELKDNSAYKDLKPAERDNVDQRVAALFRSAKAKRIGDVKEGRAELREITRDLRQSIKEIIMDVKEGRDDEK